MYTVIPIGATSTSPRRKYLSSCFIALRDEGQRQVILGSLLERLIQWIREPGDHPDPGNGDVGHCRSIKRQLRADDPELVVDTVIGTDGRVVGREDVCRSKRCAVTEQPGSAHDPHRQTAQREPL